MCDPGRRAFDLPAQIAYRSVTCGGRKPRIEDAGHPEAPNSLGFHARRGGRMFAACAITMHRHAHKPMTAHSGALPEIRLEGESVVFYLDITTDGGRSRLVLRCDPDGNVWTSIREADTRHPRRDAA